MADANKTEQATPKRRQKAREQGSIARSRELPAVLAAVGVVAVLMLVGHDAASHWTNLYRELLDNAIDQDVEPNGPLLFWCTVEVLRWIVPVLAGAMLLSLCAQLAQGGFTIAPAALQLKPERMNPAARLGQIFSVTGFSNLLKSLLPFSAIAWIGIGSIRANWNAIVHASSDSLRTFAAFLGNAVLAVAWKSALVLLVWSAIEYAFTWRKMENDLKMSKQDVKDELKQSEGSPAIKSRVRRARRQMRKRFSLKAAATATVVVTNPTHYAVALRYETHMAAPVVVAKGLDLLAQQIKELAADQGIPTVENRPLAQSLYKSVEVGDAIPSALYKAVADILVLVFKAQAELRAQEARRRSRNASGEPIPS